MKIRKVYVKSKTNNVDVFQLGCFGNVTDYFHSAMDA